MRVWAFLMGALRCQYVDAMSCEYTDEAYFETEMLLTFWFCCFCLLWF